MTTNKNLFKRLKELFDSGHDRKSIGEQEFDILDFSPTGFDGEFAFSRFGEADFITVKLDSGDLMEAAKDLGYIEMYNEVEQTIRVDWDLRLCDFSDWYPDAICPELISRAIYAEVRRKVCAFVNVSKKAEEARKSAEAFFIQDLSAAKAS